MRLTGFFIGLLAALALQGSTEVLYAQAKDLSLSKNI